MATVREEQRQRAAVGNAIRQEFYQSDAVKQFHRELLFVETLNDREQQRQQAQQSKVIADTERAMQTVADRQRAEMVRVEQERLRATQQKRDKQTYAEKLRQQVTVKDQARHQMALEEKKKERQRCNELNKQLQEEAQQLQQKQRKQIMANRSAYQKQIADHCRIREKERRQEALAEERRQQYMREEEERMRAKNKMMEEKLQRQQRRTQVVANMVAEEEHERARKYEAADARITAMVREPKEAHYKKETERKQQMQKDKKSIAADREHKLRANERRVEEEKQEALKTLTLNMQADLIHKEKEKLAVQKQRDSRKAMDQVLLQQMAQKQRRQEALAEERRQQYMREEEERMRAKNKMEEKLQRQQRRTQVVVNMVAEQEHERARKYEAADARITAMVREPKEAHYKKENERKQQMQKDMAKSIAAAREHKLRANERRVEEEKQEALKTLTLNMQADLIHKEKEKLAVQKQRDSRKAMDQVLLQQMAQKQRRQEALAEERRQQYMREEEERMRAKNKMEEKQRRQQRRTQVVANMVAEQEHERARKYEAADARITAMVQEPKEAHYKKEKERKQQMQKDKKSIAADREHKLRANERRVEEEKQEALKTLTLNMQADLIHKEKEKLAVQKQRDSRKAMDQVLLQQMAQKQRRQEALAEERRQQYMREEEERMRAKNKMEEKLRRQQRRTQVVVNMVAEQEHERARKYEAADARITAMVREPKEAHYKKENERKQQRQKGMAKSIAADREHKLRANERRVEEEKQEALKTLTLNMQADLIHKEKEKLAVQKQRDSRKAMDQVLLQQMTQKQRLQQLQKEEEMDYDIKSRDLLMHEDRQFQKYTEEVIEAAEKTNRNTIPIRRAAKRGVGKGVGPIHGGFRANYLAPDSRCKPDYVSSVANDVKKLFRTPASPLNHKKLGIV